MSDHTRVLAHVVFRNGQARNYQFIGTPPECADRLSKVGRLIVSDLDGGRCILCMDDVRTVDLREWKDGDVIGWVDRP